MRFIPRSLLFLVCAVAPLPASAGPADTTILCPRPTSENWSRMRARTLARENAGTKVRSPQTSDRRVGGVTAFSVVGKFETPADRLPRTGMDPFPTIGAGFAGVSMQDQIDAGGAGEYPPSECAACGPDHVMEVVNDSVTIYGRDGTLLSYITLDSFLSLTVGGTLYPRNPAFNPRVLYDRRSSRWFACALEGGEPARSNNQIILAVCRTSDPLTGIWDKYLIPVGVAPSGSTTYFTDYDALGIDDNGVYFGMRIYGSSGSSRAKIAAAPKAPLIASPPSAPLVYQWDYIYDMGAVPVPARNMDAVGSTSPAWFVSASNMWFRDVHYRTLTWSGGTPSLSTMTVLSTPSYSPPTNAPALGSTTNIYVGDDRLLTASIRNGHLWTCRNVGVNSSGGTTGADRTGCEWLELGLSGTTATLIQSGRVYDSAATGPMSYYYPSVMVSGQGHAAMAFSGSNASQYVGAYACGRLSGDPAGSMGAVSLIKLGEASYERLDAKDNNRWGDYSLTTVDPRDDMTFWTVQEYASNRGANIWGTWIASLKSVAPTVENPSASSYAGTSNYSFALTGTGFYDPGAGYTGRLSVALTGGAVNGISNYRVAYNSPTSATVTVDISAGASPGLRDVVVTNPDGQSATAVGGFEVMVAPRSVSIVDAKALPDGTFIELSGVCVSAAFGEVFYVEETGRTGGIRVLSEGYSVAEGTLVEVMGMMGTTESGERYIDPTSVTPM